MRIPFQHLFQLLDPEQSTVFIYRIARLPATIDTYATIPDTTKRSLRVPTQFRRPRKGESEEKNGRSKHRQVRKKAICVGEEEK